MPTTISKWLKISICTLLLSLTGTNCLANISDSITVYANRVNHVNNGHYARWVKEFQTLYPSTTVKVEGIKLSYI